MKKYCADPCFGLPPQIVNLVEYLGHIEPRFASKDRNGEYLIEVETEARKGAAVVRMYHPDWKHRCLHIKFEEVASNVQCTTWESPHPSEDAGIEKSVNTLRIQRKTFQSRAFVPIKDHVITCGAVYYNQLQVDEVEAQEMVKVALKRLELEVIAGGKKWGPPPNN